MKRILLVVAMLVAIPAFAICQTNGKKADKKGGDEQAVRQVIGELAKAVENNDLSALDRIYSDDFVFTTEKGVFQNREERFDSMRSGKLKHLTVSFDDVKIQMFGDMAVATFRSTSKFELSGETRSGEFRVTGIFVKKKGRWQEVAAQVTPILEQ